MCYGSFDLKTYRSDFIMRDRAPFTFIFVLSLVITEKPLFPLYSYNRKPTNSRTKLNGTEAVMRAEGHLPVQEISVQSFRDTRRLTSVFQKSCNS